MLLQLFQEFLEKCHFYTGIKISVNFLQQVETYCLNNETGMSSETVSLIPGSSLIKFKTSFVETVSKETKFVFYLFTAFFIFKVFISCWFSHIKAFHNICEIFCCHFRWNFLLLSLRVSFFPFKIILLLGLTFVCGKRLPTVFQNFLLSVVLFMFRFWKNAFLVGFGIFEQILRCHS